MSAVRWGLLSTAAIGSLMVRASQASEATRFVAVASRDGDRAREFADAHGIGASYPSYDAVLAADDVDAVYVPLPICMYTEGTVQWRLHPQTPLAQRLLGDGAIGELLTVRAALSADAPPGDIRRSPTLGGGSYLDLGCYCVSGIRLFAGEPERVYAEAVRDTDGVDLRLCATLRTAGGVLGLYDVGLTHPRRDELELIGTEGKIVLSDPWICRAKTLALWRDGRSEHLPVDPDGRFGLDHVEEDVYRIELDRVSAAIAGGEPLPFGRDDAVAQARVLEAVHDSSLRTTPVSW